jgi:glycyl-tRNA synthetase beta chain
LEVAEKSDGTRTDTIRAAQIIDGDRGKDADLVRLLARVKALQGFITSPDGANLLAGYKRAANILKQNPSPLAGEGGPKGRERGIETTSPSPSAPDGAPPSPAGGEGNKAEAALLTALNTAEPQVTTALAAEDFTQAMSTLATLRAPIDQFFTDVMVNDPDPAIRAHRLGLLARFRDAVHQVADFSKIEG